MFGTPLNIAASTAAAPNDNAWTFKSNMGDSGYGADMSGNFMIMPITSTLEGNSFLLGSTIAAQLANAHDVALSWSSGDTSLAANAPLKRTLIDWASRIASVQGASGFMFINNTEGDYKSGKVKAIVFFEDQ